VTGNWGKGFGSYWELGQSIWQLLGTGAKHLAVTGNWGKAFGSYWELKQRIWRLLGTSAKAPSALRVTRN
jgi:hypothetical protein